ncbi:MAG TPA: LCCL domain-containing protein [Gemmata sp.]|nr:LCCL domain-containing protein [Gemmata sp.]
MPIFRSLLLAIPVSLAAGAFFVPFHGVSAAPDRSPADSAGKQPAGLEVEVKCVDDSTLKVKLLDDKLELVTKYGFLQITIADIRRIEFANRCPADVAEKIALAISKLGDPDFPTRERATADLKSYRERAYPFLLKALKNDDPEVSRRADEAVKYIQGRVAPALLQSRENDVVYTDDSKFTGKLTAQTMRVQTAMFGEQLLKLADARSLRSGAAGASEDLRDAPTAPATLAAFQQQFGKEMIFTVTGYTHGPQQPSLWGTDVYTLDSSLAAAAVHAGVAKPGESLVVRVRILQSPLQYFASFRNGVNSTAYGNFPSGAFEFVRK